MDTKRLLNYEDSGSLLTAIETNSIELGEKLSLTNTKEEQLFYFLDGRGVMSIYEEAPVGDVYEVRQDISVYLTPMIKYEIINTGDSPLRYLVFLVKGGVAPEGELSWSAVSQRGVTIDKPAAGSGVAVTRVFDEGKNPSQEEGQHLLIRDIWLRRSQIVANAEVLTVAPGRETRLHNHYDTDESCYILYGEGKFIWNDREIPFRAGDVISYPVGVLRKVCNTGRFPLSYLLLSAHIQ